MNTPTNNVFSRKLLKSSVVRKAFGYSDVAAFWKFVRSAGVPYIALNQRRIVFDEVALNAWLDRKTVGQTDFANSDKK